jgi:hypothetical protein
VLPETRYAQKGDAHIAYQVVGEAGLDLVLVSAWFSHVDARWLILRHESTVYRLNPLVAAKLGLARRNRCYKLTIGLRHRTDDTLAREAGTLEHAL